MNPPRSDESFLYVVGIGEAERITTAKAEAEQDARLQVIDLAVGTTSSLSQKFSANSVSTDFVGKMTVNSDVLQIKGLETEAMYEEVSERKTSRLYILKRISNSDLKAFKRRYASNGKGGPELTEVSIKSEPVDVKVFVDGKFKGTSPLVLNLRSGTYELSLQSAGYKTIEKRLMVAPNNPVSINLNMEQTIGYLKLESDVPEDFEESDVYIDGMRVEPFALKEFQLEAGRHTVDINRPGYMDFIKIIDILPEQTLNLDISLKPRKSEYVQK
jgi:hypothetical protein